MTTAATRRTPLHAMTRVADNWVLRCARTLAVPDVTDHSNPAWIDTERTP